MNGPFRAGSEAAIHKGHKFNADPFGNTQMKRSRHLIMSAALAVAFLSAGAFAQDRETAFDMAMSSSAANVTVITKSQDTGFAS